MDGEVSHERESCLASGQTLVEREATHGCFADATRTSQALKAVLRRVPIGIRYPIGSKKLFR